MSSLAQDLSSELPDVGGGWQPRADVYRCGPSWVIKLEIAGVSPDDVSVATTGNQVEIRGLRKDTLPQSGYFPEQMEISYSDFTKRIELPISLRHATKELTFENGMLYIWLTAPRRRS